MELPTKKALTIFCGVVFTSGFVATYVVLYKKAQPSKELMLEHAAILKDMDSDNFEQKHTNVHFWDLVTRNMW